ncbi:MAG: phosphate-starvation-inducible PsiE family protein [Oceanidesulfovibrio sp.]
MNDSPSQDTPVKPKDQPPSGRDCHLLGSDDPHINLAHRIIRYAVKVLAFLMVFVIIWGIFDVIWVLYTKLSSPPYFLLNINDIFATFGAFMAVLIAIEIFANIVMYLESDIIHVRLVLDTAVMAAARKVIVLDFNQMDSLEILALGAILAALGVCYYFVVRGSRERSASVVSRH